MKRLFLLGAIGYPALEILYRGRTHYSMSLAGGIAALLIGRISRMRYSLAAKAVLSGLAITGVEALCGLIWNRQHQVWDYRHVRLNWKGQICLAYTILWSGMSAVLLLLLQHMHDKSRTD